MRDRSERCEAKGAGYRARGALQSHKQRREKKLTKRTCKGSISTSRGWDQAKRFPKRYAAGRECASSIRKQLVLEMPADRNSMRWLPLIKQGC